MSKLAAVFAPFTFALTLNAAVAATPCDFKGLSVGNRATPQQIMQHFGITKYADSDAPKTPDQINARLEREAHRKSGVHLGSLSAKMEFDG